MVEVLEPHFQLRSFIEISAAAWRFVAAGAGAWGDTRNT